MGIRYATREQVKAASDIKTTAVLDATVDDAVEAASRSVESLTHRKFYPTAGTRYFRWPNQQRARPWRLWLDADEVISVSQLDSGGHIISQADYFLEPNNAGPPFTSIELDRASSASFGNGPSPQRDISVTGLFGYSADTAAAGTLAALINASTTSVTVTNGAPVGVGDLLLVDGERMTVVGRSATATSRTLAAPMPASNGSVTVTLSVGVDAIYPGEVLLIGGERMLVLDAVGVILVVKRAWDGTVLATHATSDPVNVSRTLTVERGQAGTTAASHALLAPVSRNVPPGLVNSLTVAEALETINQRAAGYARTAKTAATENSKRGYIGSGYSLSVGLPGLREQVLAAYGRKARARAV